MLEFNFATGIIQNGGKIIPTIDATRRRFLLIVGFSARIVGLHFIHVGAQVVGMSIALSAINPSLVGTSIAKIVSCELLGACATAQRRWQTRCTSVLSGPLFGLTDLVEPKLANIAYV